jgi:membrane-associated phospholipid phosphatase
METRPAERLMEGSATGRPWWRALLVVAPHEYVVGAYLLLLAVSCSTGPPSPQRNRIILVLVGCAFGLLASALALRSPAQPGLLVRGLRRFAVIPFVMIAYAHLGAIVPLANPALYDMPLFQLDLLLFRVEPALAWEHWNSFPLVEWLSGWYSSYWLFVAAFPLAQVFFPVDARRAARLAVSILAITCVGHLVYLLVPGVGPVYALQDKFSGPLPGGPVHAMMMRIASNGAQRDIFPSLHTAHMLFFALFCWRESDSRVYRFLRWPVTIAAAHIIAATIVLRWHYLIDVIAGVLLAYLCFKLAHWLNPWWERRRGAVGLPETWW